MNEYGQNAIVAWNGTDEVLILSVDLGGSEATSALRVLPLPSNPIKVEQGSFDAFRKLADITNEKIDSIEYYDWGFGLGHEAAPNAQVQVTFQQEIGAHDVTVVEVSKLDGFIGWMEDFTDSKGLGYVGVSPRFADTIQKYLSRGMRFFVFDVIEVGEDRRSVEPLIYRFKSDFLYYPLEITAGSDVGSTVSSVNVLLIAKGRIDEDVVREVDLIPDAGFNYYIGLTEKELEEVSPELSDLFRTDPYVMNADYDGPLSLLTDDLVVHSEDIHAPSSADRFFIGHHGLLSYLYLWRDEMGRGPLVWVLALAVLLALLLAQPIRLLLRRGVSSRLMRNLAAYISAVAIAFLIVFFGPAWLVMGLPWIIPGILVLMLATLFILGFVTKTGKRLRGAMLL